MQVTLNISTKEKPQLLKILKVISKIEALFLVITQNSKRNNRQIISVLKSPHVNKTAQEQFEVRKYSHRIVVKPLNLEKTMFWLKALQESFSSSVKIRVSWALKNEDLRQICLMHSQANLPNPKLLKNPQKIARMSALIYIKTLDSLGETLMPSLSQNIFSLIG